MEFSKIGFIFAEKKDMAACEKCWKDAYTLSRIKGISQASCYQELLAKRADNPCTPEQQAGEDALVCPSCGRKTIHQYANYCTNCFYVEIK